MLHLLQAGKTCGLCEKACILNELFFVLKVSTPCSLLVVICVTIDAFWGFAQIVNRNKDCTGSQIEFRHSQSTLTKVNLKLTL